MDYFAEASKKYKLFEEHDCNISETALSEADPDVSFHERQEYFNGKLTLINNDHSYQSNGFNSVCFPPNGCFILIPLQPLTAEPSTFFTFC